MKKVKCTKMSKEFGNGPNNESAPDNYRLMTKTNDNLSNKHMDKMNECAHEKA